MHLPSLCFHSLRCGTFSPGVPYWGCFNRRPCLPPRVLRKDRPCLPQESSGWRSPGVGGSSKQALSPPGLVSPQCLPHVQPLGCVQGRTGGRCPGAPLGRRLGFCFRAGGLVWPPGAQSPHCGPPNPHRRRPVSPRRAGPAVLQAPWGAGSPM